jgi:alcohol dehydrogenase class IV
MSGFQFNTTRSLVCERGAAARLGELCSGLMAAPVLLVTDPGLMKLGLADAALASLEAAGLAPVVYQDVMADPTEAAVQSAAALGRDHRVGGVVGFGGGSSMDVAKLAALLLASDQELEAIYGVGLATGGRLPLVQVPTTAGTGSEVTPISIVTTGSHEKKGVVTPQLLPDLAVLDAELTLGLPPAVTAATGVDAMVHAIEAYTSRHKKNPLSDMLAREALRLLAGSIETAVHDGKDAAARQNMLLGAMLAGQAFANAPVAAVHALAYPIGGHFHVSHGLSNSLVLPHVLRFNLPAAAGHYAELAPLVFPAIAPGAPQAMAAELIEGFELLIPSLGLETRLTQVGIEAAHVPMMAEDAMKQTRLLVNNPRELTYADAAAIYSGAL